MIRSTTARPAHAIAGLLRDLRHALCTLLRDRAFALTAIGMLTLALALNVAAFTLMSAMLVRGYPLVERNDRLVYIQERGALGCCVAYGNFVAWRAQATSFEGMAFVDGRQLMIRDDTGGRERLSAPIVSPELFALLGVQPVLGRDFAAGDAAPGAAPVAILSHRLWERRYGARRDVVGETLETEDGPLTVIGVMPDGFSFPEHHDLWLPVPGALAETDRTASGFLVVARLADGATVAGAQAELTTIAERLAGAYPDTNRGVRPELKPHAEFFFGDDARILYGAMWLATWFVLLIACANLASLSVARTMGRAHELATRLALGAGRWRIGRQMLIENLLLASLSGACAWWLATWSIATYAAATASIHYVLDFSMGSDVLAYLAAIALGAGVLCALVPIANLWRIDSSASLRRGARGTTPALTRKQSTVILGQTIFAVVLLSGSGVLVRSFMKFADAPLGIDPRNVLTAFIELPPETSADESAQIAFLSTLDARLEAIPGVELAATTGHRPLAGATRRALEIEGQLPAAGAAPPSVATVHTGPDYFRAVGAAILDGRDFGAADDASRPRVAIVNQRFAATHWPNEDAVGRRLRLSGGDGEWHTVVGVASNVMQADPTRQSYAPLVYLPQTQVPSPFVWALVKTTGEPGAIAAAVRREIQGLDPDLYLTDVAPLEELVAFNAELMDVARQHLGRNAVLFPIFAGSALLLAAVGLYAVVAHSVGRRTREIGVRIAIGATSTQIRRWVLRQGLAPVMTGLVIGLVVSLGVNRLLRSQLIGVEFYDPATLAVAPVVLIIVALLACRIPARRAMRVDPVTALRRE